jgi:ubiquinone/menaquinone biosynthesis C-methylase UbiE
MKAKVELYSNTYQHYAQDPYQAVRKETYGEDIGQNSWVTADEYRRFFSLLKVAPGQQVLEIATGSGGPAVFTVKETGCQLTGIDINENGVLNATKLAHEQALSEKMQFLRVDASEALPFPEASFDVVICIDSINHLKDRPKLLQEFHRVLKKGGQLLYTDPVVITGMVTNEEIAIRSSIGFFLFLPAGENERLLQQTGFRELQARDVTENIVLVSMKWYKAREKRKQALLQFEDENNFNGLQLFFQTVHLLTSERRLSRIMFHAVK